MNINYSIPETTIYTFSDKFNTKSCLNRYDKMRPLFFKIAHGRKMVYSWIGFLMIYRLHVTYSDRGSFSMFIKVKCLI